MQRLPGCTVRTPKGTSRQSSSATARQTSPLPRSRLSRTLLLSMIVAIQQAASTGLLASPSQEPQRGTRTRREQITRSRTSPSRAKALTTLTLSNTRNWTLQVRISTASPTLESWRRSRRLATTSNPQDGARRKRSQTMTLMRVSIALLLTIIISVLANTYKLDAANGLVSHTKLRLFMDKRHPREAHVQVTREDRTSTLRKRPICSTRTGWHCCCPKFRKSDFAAYGVGVTIYF